MVPEDLAQARGVRGKELPVIKRAARGRRLERGVRGREDGEGLVRGRAADLGEQPGRGQQLQELYGARRRERAGERRVRPHRAARRDARARPGARRLGDHVRERRARQRDGAVDAEDAQPGARPRERRGRLHQARGLSCAVLDGDRLRRGVALQADAVADAAVALGVAAAPARLPVQEGGGRCMRDYAMCFVLLASKQPRRSLHARAKQRHANPPRSR